VQGKDESKGSTRAGQEGTKKGRFVLEGGLKAGQGEGRKGRKGRREAHLFCRC